MSERQKKLFSGLSGVVMITLLIVASQFAGPSAQAGPIFGDDPCPWGPGPVDPGIIPIPDEFPPPIDDWNPSPPPSPSGDFPDLPCLPLFANGCNFWFFGSSDPGDLNNIWRIDYDTDELPAVIGVDSSLLHMCPVTYPAYDDFTPGKRWIREWDYTLGKFVWKEIYGLNEWNYIYRFTRPNNPGNPSPTPTPTPTPTNTPTPSPTPSPTP